MTRKYSDLFVDWLAASGYTTCFFVAGGNSMHILESCRKSMNCIAVVHEVTAVISAEYFNKHSQAERAFVLVTAGPGLTNAVTGIAGAWLDSRELLVVGGQVKSTDLKSGDLRQRGIQEIGGIEIVESICKEVIRATNPLSRQEVDRLVELTREGRKGPVFIEICIDVQARMVTIDGSNNKKSISKKTTTATEIEVDFVASALSSAERPVILIGGGMDRLSVNALRAELNGLQIPILTSWNGADRFAADNPMWFGRPDTWGMRSANLILQQSDLILALGVRLSFQQTGFNWRAFGPLATIIHVDIDMAESSKGHPRVDQILNVDANDLLSRLVKKVKAECQEWIGLCKEIRDSLPLDDGENKTALGYVSPYKFVEQLSELCDSQTSIVPCSSGGANTVMMQAFLNKTGQIFFNNKALASMGYGLAGAIGAAVADCNRRVVLVEGDGGFSQNSQDLATVVAQNLNLKIFIFANNGYASIRMTQSNYFDGNYIGCDDETGLGFPDWGKLAGAYGLDHLAIDGDISRLEGFHELWNSSKPVLFVVKIDPNQTYFPKISSRVTTDGSMESAPLHEMSPPLADDMRKKLMPYLI